jgi:hypothetical protein
MVLCTIKLVPYMSGKIDSGPIGRQSEEEGNQYDKRRIYDGFEGEYE